MKTQKTTALLISKGKFIAGTVIPKEVEYWFRKEAPKHGGMSGFIRYLVVKEYNKRAKKPV